MSLRPCASCQFKARHYDEYPCNQCKVGGSEFSARAPIPAPKLKPKTPSGYRNPTHKRRHAAGLCTHCGKKPKKGHIYCQEMIDYQKAYHRAHYVSKKKAKP